MIRAAVALTLALALSIASGAARAEPTTAAAQRVARVEVSGPLAETPETVVRLLGLEAGSRLDDAALARLEERLTTIGYVATDVTREATDAGVVVRLVLEPVLVDHAEISGHTVEPRDTLVAFLGLQPGAHLRRDRVADLIQKLGYFGEPRYEGTPTRVVVRLALEPARAIRHVEVRGSWPVFHDDIRRRLSLRAGGRLPRRADLGKVLADEAARVRDFLRRDGYGQSTVAITVEPGGRPEWVDLRVKVSLGSWTTVGEVKPSYAEPELDPPLPCDPEADRLAIERRDVPRRAAESREPERAGACPEGFTCRSEGERATCRRDRALSESELRKQFLPRWYRPSWFGRFRLDQLHDDAHEAEEAARQGSYPAARVTAPYRLDAGGAHATIAPVLTQRGRVAIRFVGNHSIPESDLRERLTIFSAGSYDEVELAQSTRELHKLYQTRGFFEATITPRSRPLDKPGVDGAARARAGKSPDREVTFFIDEGPELRVRAVEIVPEAPIDVDLAALRAQLDTRPFPLFGSLNLAEGGYVTQQQLAIDVERITTALRAVGYPEASVRVDVARDPAGLGSAGVQGALVAAHHDGPRELYVRFAVAPGRRETIERVEFRFFGPHRRAPEELAGAMKLRAGAPYSSAALDEDLRRIERLYTSTGHPYVAIDPTEADPAHPGTPGTTWNADHTRVHLLVRVDEGPEVRFGSILVRGNFKTRESVIRSDLPFRTGDLFDVGKLAIAEANLSSHNLFNGQRVTPYGLTDRANPVPILVEVTERFDDWGTPVLSAGYATDVGLSESIGYLWGNVLGGGGSIELRGEAAEDFTQTGQYNQFDGAFWRRLQVSLRYIHPHFLIPSLRGEISGFAREEFTPALGPVQSAGASGSLSWVYSPRFRLFGRYDYTLSSLRSVEFQRIPGRGDWESSVPDSTSTSKLTFGVVLDDRLSFGGAKNPLLPVEGWLVAGSAAGAFKIDDRGHNFLVFSGQVQRYQPLGTGCLARAEHPCISLIANLRADWGIPIGEAALPAVERFFAGGDNTTRGFDTDMLKTEIIRGDVSPAPPTGVTATDGTSAYRIIPQGGNIRILGTVELQFPIGQLGSYPWMGAFFMDAGTIFDSADLFTTSDIKVSIGVTLLRILTPVGPLSLEYAYPLTQSLAEDQWEKETSPLLHWPGRIHFNWGIPILR